MATEDRSNGPCASLLARRIFQEPLMSASFREIVARGRRPILRRDPISLATTFDTPRDRDLGPEIHNAGCDGCTVLPVCRLALDTSSCAGSSSAPQPPTPDWF